MQIKDQIYLSMKLLSSNGKIMPNKIDKIFFYLTIFQFLDFFWSWISKEYKNIIIFYEFF